MGRDRYQILDPTAPHFLTCTVLEWLPLFALVRRSPEKNDIRLHRIFSRLDNAKGVRSHVGAWCA